ncbi:MAG TPA: uroporphyrinogen-III synthase [Pyrinomonadaceae bacterium]|nr:uroporphyrinogen-III synthase [Pyrinomonadaceae bacterium]
MTVAKPTTPVPAAGTPLAGRTVVITRAVEQADEFSAELERFGARVVVCPTIEIRELEHFEALDEAIDHLYGYDWIIFTSVNGAKYFFERFAARGHEVTEIDKLRVCAIGEPTADKLRDLHVHVDVVPEESRAEGVFAAIVRYVGSIEALDRLNVLIPRALVGRDFLPKALQDAGARVDLVPVYRTTLPDNLDRGRIAAMLSGDADCIAFTSSSTVKNLGQLFDTNDLSSALAQVVVACIGDVTTNTAREFGLQVHIQPEQSSVGSLARAIADYFSSSHN